MSACLHSSRLFSSQHKHSFFLANTGPLQHLWPHTPARAHTHTHTLTHTHTYAHTHTRASFVRPIRQIQWPAQWLHWSIGPLVSLIGPSINYSESIDRKVLPGSRSLHHDSTHDSDSNTLTIGLTIGAANYRLEMKMSLYCSPIWDSTRISDFNHCD